MDVDVLLINTPAATVCVLLKIVGEVFQVNFLNPIQAKCNKSSTRTIVSLSDATFVKLSCVGGHASHPFTFSIRTQILRTLFYYIKINSLIGFR